MHASQKPFACEECDTPMDPMYGVPVLQSLQGHAVHRCGACGHILLVQEVRDPEWSARWLGPLFMDCEPTITCVARM